MWGKLLRLWREWLGGFERDVLAAVRQLDGRGYGLTICNEVERVTGKRVSLGAIYAVLDRLERQGRVTSELEDATPARGGRPKRYYRVVGT